MTHDQTEAMALAHRAVMTATGVVQQVGTPTGTNPANGHVTGFIGCPAMKLVEGRTAGGIFKSGHMKIEGLSATDGPITVELRAEDPGLGSEGHDEDQARSMRSSCWGMPPWSPCAGGGLVSVKAPTDFRADIGDTASLNVAAEIAACSMQEPVREWRHDASSDPRQVPPGSNPDA